MHLSPHLLADRTTKHTYRTDVVRQGMLQFSVNQQVDLSAATTDVYIDIITCTIGHTLDMVVVDHSGFFLTINDFNRDTGIFQYLLDNGFPITSIPHGRSGTSTVIRHIINLHQLAKSFH